MADVFTAIAKFTNSPPGQLAAGGVLAGIVWKFFERVEAVLTENTKLEIAVWLLDRKKLSPTFQSWPDTFAKVFDRVFGDRHLSWKCFWRSAVISIFLYAMTFVLGSFEGLATINFLRSTGNLPIENITLSLQPILPLFVTIAIIGDYCALLETRLLLAFARRFPYSVIIIGCMLGDLIVTCYIADFVWFINQMFAVRFSTYDYHWPKMLNRVLPVLRGSVVFYLHSTAPKLYIPRIYALLWFYPAFFTSIWLWLYAGSGFILKAVRRFDIGFDWFNRKFDIEKKPLQSIGLVAGALVAVVYWAAVVVARVL